MLTVRLVYRVSGVPARWRDLLSQAGDPQCSLRAIANTFELVVKVEKAVGPERRRLGQNIVLTKPLVGLTGFEPATP
jgi:hypothetical protein